MNPTVAAKPPMPREHGAWGILLLPFATAVGVAGMWNLPVSLLLGSILCFYLARTSFLKQNLRWTMILLTACALLAAPLLAVWNLWWLLAFGAVAGPLAFRKTERGWTMQLSAVGGLTLTAPAAWYVATGKLDAMAGVLWLLNILYFAGGVLYVKMHLDAALRRQPSSPLCPVTIAYYVVTLLIMLAGAAAKMISYWVALAFLPVTVRAVVGVVRLSPTLRLKRLGWTEVAYSVLYAGLLIAAWRLA